MSEPEDVLFMIFEGLPLLIIFGFLWLAAIILTTPFVVAKYAYRYTIGVIIRTLGRTICEGAVPRQV